MPLAMSSLIAYEQQSMQNNQMEAPPIHQAETMILNMLDGFY